MNHDTLPAQGPVDVLVGRLRAHAGAHEYIANADPEQRQWMEDLYDAADALERLRSAPVAIIDTRDVLGICAPAEEDFPALYALQGKRVRLVLEEAPNAEFSGAAASSPRPLE